jgi:hypothetical protein
MPTSIPNARAANNSTAPRAIKWFFMAISGDSDFVFMFIALRLPSHLTRRTYPAIGPMINFAISDRKKRLIMELRLLGAKRDRGGASMSANDPGTSAGSKSFALFLLGHKPWRVA